jgi:hypothetical protein
MFVIDAFEYISKMRELNRLKVRVVELSAMVDYFREKCYSMEKEQRGKKMSNTSGGIGDIFGDIFK